MGAISPTANVVLLFITVMLNEVCCRQSTVRVRVIAAPPLAVTFKISDLPDVTGSTDLSLLNEL